MGRVPPSWKAGLDNLKGAGQTWLSPHENEQQSQFVLHALVAALQAPNRKSVSMSGGASDGIGAKYR